MITYYTLKHITYVHLLNVFANFVGYIEEEIQKESLLFKLCIFCVIYFKTKRRSSRWLIDDSFQIYLELYKSPTYEQNIVKVTLCMCMLFVSLIQLSMGRFDALMMSKHALGTEDGAEDGWNVLCWY